MIDMKKITIRRVNSIGIAHGEPLSPDDLPWLVAEEVGEAIIERDKESGEFEVDGQRYRWSKEES